MRSKSITVVHEDLFLGLGWELLDVSHGRAEIDTDNFTEIVGSFKEFLFFGKHNLGFSPFTFFLGFFFRVNNDRLILVFNIDFFNFFFLLFFSNFFFNFFLHLLLLHLLFGFGFRVFHVSFIILLNLLHESLGNLSELILAFLEVLFRLFIHLPMPKEISQGITHGRYARDTGRRILMGVGSGWKRHLHSLSVAF